MTKTAVLFVCLGNICRSPSAEAVFRRLVEAEGLADVIRCDSAGTSGFHMGDPSDSRMRHFAAKRGIELTSISRQFYPDHDFEAFDWIVGMDESNVADLRRLAGTQQELDCIHLMTDFCTEHKASYVPDPYYGGDEGFEEVLDILEDACGGLFRAVVKSGAIKNS